MILEDRIQDLLLKSLDLWRVDGEVCREEDGALLLVASGKRFRIVRAPPALPFRWLVTTDGHERGVTSIAGLLRTIRAGIDPAYRPVRLRIASLPAVPS